MNNSKPQYSMNNIIEAYPFGTELSFNFSRTLKHVIGGKHNSNIKQYLWREINASCMYLRMKTTTIVKLHENLCKLGK